MSETEQSRLLHGSTPWGRWQIMVRNFLQDFNNAVFCLRCHPGLAVGNIGGFLGDREGETLLVPLCLLRNL